MRELTQRQRTILLALVGEHIEAAQPVGSQRLAARHHLDMSPATIRNEMVTLTELGYLKQPHTSAGRVPTEEAYRLFVGDMLTDAQLPSSIRNTIVQQFRAATDSVEQWLQLAVAVLARQSRGASLVTPLRAEVPRFQHLELIATQGRQILMILVMVGGEVSQQLLTLAEPVEQSRLSEVAGTLNRECTGKRRNEIAASAASQDALLDEIRGLVSAELGRAMAKPSGEMLTDGVNNMLASSDFTQSEGAQRALRLIEERTSLRELVDRTMVNSTVGGMQVLIGGGDDWQDLTECSMVLARYGVPGLASGTLGVVGPIRMAYARTIPTVRLVANLLSEMVTDQMQPSR